MNCDHRSHTTFQHTKPATSRIRTGTDRYVHLCDPCLMAVRERYTIPICVERLDPLPLPCD